jgi:2-keto-4-pentenoate hydratase
MEINHGVSAMTNRTTEAASLLLDARRTGKRLKALPESCAPRSLVEAYEIQHAVLAGLGATIAGYKISIFPDGVNAVAPILADLVVADGAVRPLAPSTRMGIELEFGFRFGRAVAATASAADVLAAIDATVVTLELCDTRYETIDGMAREALVADMISNSGAVPGTATPFDAHAGFKGATCRQLFDGKLNTERTASHPNGDPLLPLALVPKTLAEGGYALEPGQFVITGSLTGITWVEAPLLVTGEIDGFGQVACRLAR